MDQQAIEALLDEWTVPFVRLFPHENNVWRLHYVGGDYLDVIDRLYKIGFVVCVWDERDRVVFFSA